MTSSASRLSRYGVSECAGMMWSAPSSLACCSILLYVVVVEVWDFGGLVLRNPLCMSAILVMWVFFIWFGGFDLRPCAMSSFGGSASVKVMSGRVLSSTTLRAPSSASSLYTMPMCDLTFPIWVVYPLRYLSRMMLSASLTSSLCW